MRGTIALGLASAVLSLAAAPILPRDERKEQEQAVAVILKLGGTVMYDYQRPDPNTPNKFEPDAKPKNPDEFHRVVCVDLGRTKVTDGDLKVLAFLPRLENLTLTDTQITGAGLAPLKGLTSLRVLGLWKTQVDDGGLEHIKGLTKLWQLVLDETRVTDAGLIHLKDLTELTPWLGLPGTRVTDAGLVHLQRLTKLKFLNLCNTPVTADGVKGLRVTLPKTDISFGK